MKVRLTGPILSSVLLAVLPLASCGGGSTASTSGAIAGCSDGSQSLCVTRCNLGCSTSGCSISNIAVNQRLEFQFNLEVDAASVNTNTIKIRSSTGNEPVGSFLVQGATISFIPEVEQAGGETFFGFESGKVYTLTIPGKDNALNTLRSTSGDSLAEDFTCRLNVTLGIVDFDGQPPRASMLLPDTVGKDCIARDANILLEFSELVDPQTLGEAVEGVKFLIAQADNQGNCSTQRIALPGVRTISVDQITQRTRLGFRPAFEPPGGFCILAEVTGIVRDLAGKRARTATFSFETCAGDVPTRTIVEDFSDTSRSDPVRNGAKWIAGNTVAPVLGGSGLHGDFDHRLVAKDLAQKDERDRDIWELNVDSVTFRDTVTLSGKQETVTNGIFEFMSFEVPSSVNLRLVGTKVPVIRVTGRMQIDGILDVATEDAIKLVGQGGRPPVSGQTGFKGGIGGGAGGPGADSPHFIGTRRIDGGDGDTIQLPNGHPLASQAAATAGKGTITYPASGRLISAAYAVKDKDVDFSAFTNVISQMATSGGGGGGFVGPGAAGSVVKNSKGTEAPQAFDYGPAGTASGSVSISSLSSRTEASSYLYLVGGAGGGGGGSHPSTAYDASGFEAINWTPGSGGAGGGGIMHLQIGGDLNVGIRGEIRVRGGNGQQFAADTTNFTNPAPGGGGSGGSLLMQVGGVPDIRGRILATGGDAGHYDSSTYTLSIDSLSGAGGDGLLRYESNPPAALATLTNLRPAVSGDNVGPISKQDENNVAVLASEWYDTGLFFPPKFVRYEIEATIDNQDVVFSDDSSKGRQASAGEPVEILFQGSQLNPTTKRPDPKTLSNWFPAVFDSLSSAGGNAFRVLIRFNRDKASSIVLKKITYVYKG